MHRVFSVFVASVLIIFSVPALSSENYDSQNTMSALNIAVVSVNKILTTQDKIVLEWEYDNIINRLALGNIQSDSEMKQLYQELLDFITKKKLRQEDSKRLRESYKQREREAYYKSMHGSRSKRYHSVRKSSFGSERKIKRCSYLRLFEY